MPPRIPIQWVAKCCLSSIERPAAPATTLVSLFAALSIAQSRSASILADLRDNPGAYNKRIRKGRGPSSGYGKTSGRGHKGQKQHGKVKPWFQGGQTPLIVKHGRMGFVNHRAEVISELNLEKLQKWIDQGRIDPTKQITPKEIIQSRLVTSIKDGVKLLAGGKDSLKTPVNILVSRASAAAIAAVEATGGKVMTRYFTRDSIKRLVRGTSVSTNKPLPVGGEHVDQVLEKSSQGPFMYRLPDPTSRWDIEYYRDPAHRGYLSDQIKPGESPSLYFRVPGRNKDMKKIPAGAKKGPNKIAERDLW